MENELGGRCEMVGATVFLGEICGCGFYRDGMLHRNHFPKFFVLMLLQVLITCFYLDPKAQREFEVRLEGLISDRHAKFRAEMIEFLDAPIAEKREFRKSTKALGTPSSKD